MKLDEIKEKIQSVELPSQYVRVSVDHPLELYLGKNEKGYLTLRFNGYFIPTKVIGTNLIEVKQVKTSKYNSILFSLLEINSWFFFIIAKYSLILSSWVLINLFIFINSFSILDILEDISIYWGLDS